MGSYTTNYKLLKVGDGTGDDPTDDYVDVNSQLDRNFQAIDDFANKAINYPVFDNTVEKELPKAGQRAGDKLLSTWDMSSKVFSDESEWHSSNAKAPIWTNVAMQNGFSASSTANTYRPAYFQRGKTVKLRGRVVYLAFSAWTRGTIYSAFAAGTFPAPSVVKEFMLGGGVATGRTPQFYYLTINTDGSASLAYYSSGNQASSSSENYTELTGVSYDVS